MQPFLSGDEKRSHFRNLVILAMKDGEISGPEKQILQYIAMKWGIADFDWKKVIEDPDAIQAKFPRGEAACFQQLFDLVDLMISDGVLKGKERELTEALAAKLGYSPEAVDKVKDAILEANRSGKPVEQIHSGLMQELSGLRI